MKKLTPPTHKPNNTQPHDKNTHMQQQQHPQKHIHTTTTNTTTTTTIKNRTPRTIIGHSPHPPTCVWVGWVFI